MCSLGSFRNDTIVENFPSLQKPIQIKLISVRFFTIVLFLLFFLYTAEPNLGHQNNGFVDFQRPPLH